MTKVATRQPESVQEIIELLKKEYPDAKIALNYSNPLELLVATILSAQCPDERVNQVTHKLFRKYRTAEDYANADIVELEEDIKPTGFYRVKARNLKRGCALLVERFDSQVPQTIRDLTLLPGVARKTAHMVLSNVYGVVEGIAVDTHVRRLSRRLGWTENIRAPKIEHDLMTIVPREEWFSLPYHLIDHGRKICKARKPLCGKCVLNPLCPSATSFQGNSR